MKLTIMPKERILEAIQFNLDNLPEILEWLGTDFCALCAGVPITINNDTKIDFTPTDKARYCIVISSPADNKVVAAVETDYIARDDEGHYTLMNEQYFMNYYSVVEVSSNEDDDMRDADGEYQPVVIVDNIYEPPAQNENAIFGFSGNSDSILPGYTDND